MNDYNNRDLKKGQTDKDLYDFAFHYNITINKIDFLENINLNQKGYYIINLDGADVKDKKTFKQGTHWVVLIIKNTVFYYFDSFGFRSPITIEEYCKKNKIKLYYNTIQFQKLNEYICGFYCLLFLYITQNVYRKLDSKFDFYNILQEYKHWDIIFNKN
jgi:hypothetical protein